MELPTNHHPLVLAITGASGAVYAVRLLQCLCQAQVPVHLLISPSGAAVVQQELQLDLGTNRDQIDRLLEYSWPDASTLSQWPIRSIEQVEADRKFITLH
ncbi:MAG: flavoprotein, partial [Pirellula sp.]